ncbi:hypothetical protein AN641_01445 [Candidatus Epulonipiscioides gigas]|nr:hypothetical protein AN641_01445 [Epulopiscium sp. SCG-C07WGA-EpuloA2]
MDKLKKFDFQEILNKGLVFGVLIGLVILFAILTGGKFIQPSNLITIVSQIVPYALLGFGMTFILITGGIDLSVGSILGFGGILCAKLIIMGCPIWLAILFSLIAGAGIGFINGYCVTKLAVVPFIVTLGTQFAFRGLTQLIGGGKPVSIQAMEDKNVVNAFIWIGNGEILGIPVPIIIMIITGIILGVILAKTGYGRRIYAVGSNEEASRLSGINVTRTKLIAYTLSGLTSTIAGILLAAKLASAQSNAGTGYELEGIAAAVIGGTSVNGGVGTILGTIIGAFVMGVLRNGLNLLKVNAFIQMIIIGAIIVIGVWYDTKRRNKIKL